MSYEEKKLDKSVREHRELMEDYRKTFIASAHGKRVLEDLLGFCRVFEECDGQKDEGKRLVGLYLLGQLDRRNLDGLIENERNGLTNTNMQMEAKNG